MSIAVMKTKAEEALAAQFGAVAAELPGGAWVPEARRQAMHWFERQGLPHRRIEEWKYTDLRTALKTAHPPATCSSVRVDEALLIKVLGAALAALPAIRLVIVNGRMAHALVPTGHEAGAGYRYGALSGVLGQPGYEWVKAHFTHGSTSDPVLALNAAFAADGIVLRVEEGASLGLPIHIVSIADTSAPVAIATRNLIKVERGAKATIIESHVELGSASSQATAVTQLDAGVASEVVHVKHVAADSASAHIGRLNVEVATEARFRAFQLTAGAGLLRNESWVRFTGADAKLDLSGAMLGRGSDHIDTTLVVHHTTPGCESRELFKSVLDDRARAVFQGKVIVDPVAQKTDGKQMAQALMLSEDAEFDSKPELEIYADDVACGHGSTAAEIDSAMLFYLRSRGIPKNEARAMLIESFVGEAIEKVEDEALREALMANALAWLRRK